MLVMRNSAVCYAVVLAAVSACGGSGSTTPGASGGDSSAGGAGVTGGSANNGGQSSAAGGLVQTGGSASDSGGAAAGGVTSAAGGSQTAGGSGATGGKAGGTTPASTGGGKAGGGTASAAGGTAASGGKAGGGAPPSTGGTAATGGKAGGGTAAAGGTKATTGGSSNGNPGGSTATGGSSSASTSTGCVATIPGNGCTPPAAYTDLFVCLSGHTQAQVDSKVSAAWSQLFNPKGSGTIYYDGPGSDESYVEDTYNNDVRTEGMSYGMMIAVQLDHQTEFDRLWTWVRNHMAQNCTSSGCTGQIAWHCSTSGSKDATGGAPDGDEYFAAALVFAHNRWGDTTGKWNYATEAQWVLDLIRTQDFDKSNNIVEFYSGSGNTDPSYILPAFYQTWACFDTANADFWNAAATAGRTVFHGANSSGVLGDQTSFTGTGGSPGADTIRCVVNIMMDHNFFDVDAWQTQTYAPEYAANQKNVNGGAQGFCDGTLGFGLPASSGKPFVDNLWNATCPSHDYWDGVLYMLALLHVSGTFHLYY